MKLWALDIETTGLDPEADDVLEIAIGLYDTDTKGLSNGLVIPVKAWEGDVALIRERAWEGAKRFDDAELLSGADPKSAMVELNTHISTVSSTHGYGVPYIMGHNVGAFDITFLRVWGYRHNARCLPGNVGVDTRTFAHILKLRGLVPDTSLSSCVKWAGIRETTRHRAWSDVLDVCAFYSAFMHWFAKECKEWNP